MSNARERARQLRAREQPPAETPEKPARPTRKEPYRQTVDLTPDMHRAFAAWRLETALVLGRTRLTTQDTLEATVAVLLEDETVARRVRAWLEEQDTR